MALESSDKTTENHCVKAAAVDTDRADQGFVFSVTTSQNLADVEAAWRSLEAQGVESPGESYDYIRHWIEGFSISPECQLFVVAWADDRPIAVFALHRRRIWGMNVLTDFPGVHVATNAPLTDAPFISALAPSARGELWQKIRESLTGADLVYLHSVPELVAGHDGLFDDFGTRVAGDRLHRSVFSSWEECDAEQRSRSRRKHDKQKGAKLNALGSVDFQTYDSGEDTAEIFELMFQQRADRFKQLGITDPFDTDDMRRFYRNVFEGGTQLKGRLHVLKLNGDTIAIRYNLIHEDQMFCLISSMDLDPKIQPGSPGKQCILRVMQSEFDNGISMFDMGSGMTDEKRHWCNQHIQLYHHYVPLTPIGRMFTLVHRSRKQLKMFLKSNEKVFSFLKSMRSVVRGRAVK